MLDWDQCPLVERVPGRVNGAWVFEGTRVPVKALFENLEAGACIDDFLAWFPGVTREQVLGVLEFREEEPRHSSGGNGEHLAMRILLDQGPPVPMRRALTGHTVGPRMTGMVGVGER